MTERAVAWNEIFKQQGKFFREPHEDMPMVGDLLEEHRATRVLDLGCGTGRHVVYLVRRGFSVCGLDSSPEGLRVARQWLGEEGLDGDLRLQDMTERLPYEDGFFDAVISVQVIHHADMATIRRIVEEILRVLKPGGFVFVTVPELKDGKPYSWQGMDYEEVGPHTFLPLTGPERGLLHTYFTPESCREAFGDLDIIDLHVDSVHHHCVLGFKH